MIPSGLGHRSIARSRPRGRTRGGRRRPGAAYHRPWHRHRIARARLRPCRTNLAAHQRFGTSRRSSTSTRRASPNTGQWPWPRHLVAELVRRIAQGHPRVVGIDFVFAERDRLSPTEIARELPGLSPALADALAQLPPSDRDLAEALAAVPTVLALVPSREQRAQSSDPLRPPRSARRETIRRRS